MQVGIVGSEAAKFTALGEANAKRAIHDILSASDVTAVVSGHCHLGGIDIYAEDIGRDLGKELFIFPPKKLNWSEGYKPRNLLIAKNSDVIYCITPDVLPDNYTGMRFKTCYHCLRAGRSGTDHIKSGGCWTLIEGMKMGKEAKWLVVSND